MCNGSFWVAGMGVSYLMVFYFSLAASTHDCPIKPEYLYSGAFQITGAISTLEFSADHWKLDSLYLIHSEKYRWLKSLLIGQLLAYFYAAVLLSFAYFPVCYKKIRWWLLLLNGAFSCAACYLAYLGVRSLLDQLTRCEQTGAAGAERIKVIKHSLLRLEVLLRDTRPKKTYLSLHEVCKLRPDVSPKYLYLRVLRDFLVFPSPLAVKLHSLKCEGCHGLLDSSAIPSVCRCTRPFHYSCYKRYVAGRASCEFCRQQINQELVNKARLYISNSLTN